MIGLISDTHEQVEDVKIAVDFFKKNECELVIHAGDIISAGMLSLYKGLNIKFVFGNNDGDEKRLNYIAETLGFEKITNTKEFTHEGKKFFVCHGHENQILKGAISSERFDYVICGHTHDTLDEKTGKTRVINPGSLFTNEKSVATLDVKKDELIFKKW